LNPSLKIMGRPDGVDLARGALLPIEIKSHKDVQALDEFELAFYWLLLDPLRTRRDAAPGGLLILQRDGAPAEVRIKITPNRIERVTRLLPEILRAREYGVQPQVCGCDVCRTVLRDEILAAVARTKHPSLLFGVGRTYARLLAELGFPTWTSVLKADPEVLAERFRSARHYSVTPAEIRRWQLHGHSYRKKKPLLADDASPFPVGEHFLTLDLEYDTVGDDIWLIGGASSNPATSAPTPSSGPTPVATRDATSGAWRP
jgi:predicted RecB family nuclease